MRQLVLAACVLAVACGPEDELSGSLDQVYVLKHSGTRARLYSSELAVEYLGPQQSVPVRVSLRLAAIEEDDRILAPGRYDLAVLGDITGAQADGSVIPRFSSGRIDFDAVGTTPGARVEGSFSANFATERDTLGLSGSFATRLDVIEEPEIVPRPEEEEAP